MSERESSFQVDLWSGEEPPAEDEIQRLLRDEGLSPYRWSNAPGDVYGPHTHPYHKVVYVVRGAITFGFPGRDHGHVTLRAGDRLDLAPDVPHGAVVGPEGVTCLEAHRNGE